MKLSDLIQEHDLTVRAENALKAVDWNFDVDGENLIRFAKGTKILKEAEKMVGELYQVSPEQATELWAKYCPYARPGSLPRGALCK